MSGSCYKNADRNTMWSSNWNARSSDIQEQDSVSDIQSQYSDATTSELNPAETADVRARMRKLFELQSFTDVTFYPKNNRRVFISAHRAILAVSSPLFTKMLFDDQTKVTVGEKLEVQISNLSFDAFTSIVKYLYTDEVSFDNDVVVQGILDGAKQFRIYSLVNKCKEYFENVELTSDNVCSKVQMSTSNKIVALKERCIEFIQKNTLSVIKSADFQKCNSTTVRAICKLQSLNLSSEMELLEAVMQWLHSQPYHERKGLLEPLLKCIRFLNLTVGEMGDTLKKYPDIMTADEGLSIMLFLYNPPKNPNFTGLPSWCNKNMESRCFFKEEDVHASQTRASKKFGEWKHKTNKAKHANKNTFNHPQSNIHWPQYSYDIVDKVDGMSQRNLLGSTEAQMSYVVGDTSLLMPNSFNIHGLNVVDPKGNLVGKVIFPLTPDPGQGFVSELTSLLQLKCISGSHQIKAIRLSFERPMSDKCRINSLFIKARVAPSGFNTTENVQIVNSESVRVEFRKTIKVRRGDSLDIEAEARHIEFYKFLQFDETCPMPANPHFGICISSSPKQGKLYFISEIEYGPQDRPKFGPQKFKNRNPKK